MYYSEQIKNNLYCRGRNSYLVDGSNQRLILERHIWRSLHQHVGVVETGASCYRGRLLQGHFMRNYYIDGEIADSSFILIHQRNH